jgi:predicted nucleotidyltransferase
MAMRREWDMNDQIAATSASTSHEIDEREQIIACLSNFFARMGSHYGVEMAFLYGSWAKGFPRPDSDVDVAVVFTGEPRSQDEVFARITNISLSLSRELKREVSVLQIDRDFEKPLLYYNAVVLGVPVYTSVKEDYITLINESIRQMEDFSIFGIGWQYEIARKNLEAVKNA